MTTVLNLTRLEYGDRALVIALYERLCPPKVHRQAHVGYVRCALCGTEDDCYSRNGVVRCNACRRKEALR